MSSTLELELVKEGLRQALPGLPLEFQHSPRGIGAAVFFPNGYGGHLQDIGSNRDQPDGFFELLVYVGCPVDNSATYKTPVTNDVVPGLDSAAAVGLLVKISQLRPNAHTLTCRYCAR